MVIILFGVTGAGKTTVGRLLAQQLGWKFYDADEFHTIANIEKMKHGIPLTDEDRRPWLEHVRRVIGDCLEQVVSAVFACSALKRSYRRFLHINDDVKFVYLEGEFQLILERLQKRHGHFAGPELLQSQFDTLEAPGEEATAVHVGPSPEEIVQSIRKQLGI